MIGFAIKLPLWKLKKIIINKSLHLIFELLLRKYEIKKYSETWGEGSEEQTVLSGIFLLRQTKASFNLKLVIDVFKIKYTIYCVNTRGFRPIATFILAQE